MKQLKLASLIASAIVATAASGVASTANITGLNQWGQYGDPLPITVTTEKAASGSASLGFDVADSANGVLSLPQVVFAAPIVGGTVSVSMNAYFPSGNKFAFLYGIDDGAAGDYVQISSYANDASGGFGQVEATNVAGSTGSYNFVRDQWKTLKLVIDLDHPGVAGNGKFYYDDMVTPAGSFTYGSNTISEFWLIPSKYYTGTEVTGPFYFDDIEVTQTGTSVWSDNFDNYIAVAPVNDNFADAIVLAGASGSHTGSGNVAASLESDEPVCVYPETTNTVWFKWVCANSGSLSVSTTGSTNTSGSEWDACLAIYTGTSLATLTNVVSQDSGLDETVSFPVTAGSTYYIQAGGFAPPSPGDAANNILLHWTFAAPPPNVPGVVSIDVVRTDSTAVSGDVIGSPVSGQTGLWNRLDGSVSPQTLGTLTNGAGAVASGVGFQIVGTTGYARFQSSGTVSGVVLAANDPERLWVSGSGTRTFAFTGLTAGGAYTLAIFNTGSSKGVVTINGGTPHSGFSTVLVTNEVADGTGNITIVESFNGAQDSDYMEISGFQIFATGPVPSAYDAWSALHAGGGTPGEDYNHDGVQNGCAYFMGATGLATNPGVVNGKISWPHVGTVASFAVQVSTDLATWTAANPADVDTTSSPGHVIYTLPTGAAHKFCRLVVTP
ncbi:MAG: hypothetical protein WCK77_06680 [Verrucomicrobiota bacterium]